MIHYCPTPTGKLRTLTIGDYEVTVSNRHGIINPGKFEGEMPHAVRDYGTSDNWTGDQSIIGVAAWQTGHRYYKETDNGFVTEIDKDEYDEIDKTYNEACEAEGSEIAF